MITRARPDTNLTLAIVAIAFSADLATFLAASTRVDVVAIETNRLMADLWAAGGPGTLAAVKLACLGGVVALAALLRPQLRRRAFLFAASIATIGAATNVWALVR